MKHFINDRIDDIVKKARRRRTLRALLAFLCTTTILVTSFGLRLPADTLERAPLCGIEDHEHTDACYPTPTEEIEIAPESTLEPPVEEAGIIALGDEPEAEAFEAESTVELSEIYEMEYVAEMTVELSEILETPEVSEMPEAEPTPEPTAEPEADEVAEEAGEEALAAPIEVEMGVELIDAEARVLDIELSGIEPPFSLLGLMAMADTMPVEADGIEPPVAEIEALPEVADWTLDYDKNLLAVEFTGWDYSIEPLCSFDTTALTVEADAVCILNLNHYTMPLRFPAMQFETWADGLRVSVAADEGAFPEGTTMEVSPVYDESTLDGIAEMVETEGVAVRKVHAVDITFRDASGQPIEPLIPISVQMSVDELKRSQSPVVVHLDDAGNTELIEMVELPVEVGEAVMFDAAAFSVYALVVTERYISADGSAWNIVVTYGADADIPDGATLDVRELVNDEYQDCLKRAAGALNGQPIAAARFFDIGILSNGQHIQPAAPVEVSVSMAREDGTARAVHFGDKIEVIRDVRRDGDAVVFDAQGFSVYGILYTVDFEAEGYAFSIEGGGTIRLSELLNRLNIEANLTGSIVTFTDDTLLSLTPCRDDADIVTDWELVSLKPFLTAETLTVTLSDGTVIEIRVTDAVSPISIVNPAITLSLVDGAVQEENGDWVYHAQNPDREHAFSFQIDYSFSTDTVEKRQWEAGQIEIHIPLSVLRNRSNALSDTFLMSLPQAGSAGLTEENEFVYSVVGNELVISNRVAVRPTQVGFIQFSYLTAEQSFAYGDYQSANEHVSDPIQARLIIRGEPGESFTVGTDQVSTYELLSEVIQVHIDTTAQLTATNKRAPTKYTQWQASWGTEPTRPDEGEYVYLLWSIESNIRATQPFHFDLTDVVQITEDIDHYEVVGFRPHGQSQFTMGSTFPQVQNLTPPSGEMIRTDYVLTRHSISDLPASWNEYIVKNTATATVTPADRHDAATTKSDDETFADQRIRYGGRPGNINAGKWGLTTSYQLSELIEKHTPVTDLRYDVFVEGYTWYYTYQGENGETAGRDDDYSDTNYQYYGQREVTFTIQENNQPNELAPDPTAERHNLRVWYKQPGRDEYGYSDWLKPGDYQIDQIDYSYVFRNAVYDQDAHNFIPTGNLTDAQIIEKNIDDIVFTLERDGVQLDGEVHYSFGQYTSTGSAANYVSNESAPGTLVFNPDAHITGYTCSNTNALYYTLLRTVPSFSLRYNDGDSVLRPVLASLGEKPTMNLWNTAILKVTQGDDLKNYYTRQHFDTVLGDFKESRITKGWIARHNDPVRRMYTITWNVDMEETYTIDDETSYVRQEGGRFYDLLPLGTEYVPGSLEVYADGVPLAEGEYFTNLETNYGYEGRDLLSVGIIAPANRKYTFSYDTQITWNTILERRQGGTSLTLHNAVAYVKNIKGAPKTIAGYDGNLLLNDRVPAEDAMLTAKLREADILGNIDPIDKYKYALMTAYDCEVTAVVSGTLGLNKLVRGANPAGKFEKSDFTYTSDEYAYRLSFGPYAGTQAKDLILFDFLENWQSGNDHSLWHGAFKSIEMKIVEDRGVDAKLYVSTLPRETLTDNATNFASATGKLEDIRYNDGENDIQVWEHISKPDDGAGEPPNFTAIAIDLRKKQDGTDFVLDGGETLSVTLHMTAPDSVEDDTLNAPAYNDVYLQQAIKNRGDLEYQPTAVIYQGHTEINYRVAGDLWLLKVDSTDPTKTVGGTTFQLTGTSAYGTPVDLTGTTSDEGWLSFQHLEMTPENGHYELREVSSSPDYLLDDTVLYVEVDDQGHASIVNAPLPAHVKSVYIDVSGEPRLVQAPGNGVVEGWRIGNAPRMHGDLVFAKRGTIDRKNTSIPLAGATFRLTPVEGGTHYHNTDVHEATSDAEGNVVFPNIEWGEYTLEEISAPQGYLLLKEKFTVTCDGTDGVVIRMASETQDSRFFEAKAKDSATDNKMDKAYTITNEAVHELKLYKVDAESGEKLAGAAFALTGTSESGAAVNLTAQSLADGTVTFTPLEPGKYYLQETQAPDNHVKDATIYTVTVQPDGGVGIAWGTESALNYHVEHVDGEDVKRFIVAENAIEGNSRHEASEIYYDGFGKRFNFPNARERSGIITICKEWLKWDGSSALPVPVVEVSTTVKRAQQTPAFIDPDKWRAFVRERFRYSGSQYCTKFLRYDSANFAGGQAPRNNGDDGWILVSSTEKPGYEGKLFVRQEGKILYWWADTEEIFIKQRTPSAEYEAGWDLFRGTYIEEADLSAFTLSNETESLWKAFAYCPNLTRVVLPKFQSRCHVTTMAEMFLDDKKLSEVRFQEIDTSSVTTMSKMFYNCYMLERIVGLEQFDTQQCDNMEQMFAFCGNGTPNGISELDLSSFTIREVIQNTPKVSCYEMFWGMTYLKTIYVSDGWVNANIRVESRNGRGNRMFIYCPALVGEKGTTNVNDKRMLAQYARVDGGEGDEGLLTYRAKATAPPSSEVRQSEIDGESPSVTRSSVLYTTSSDQWAVSGNVWTYEMPVYDAVTIDNDGKLHYANGETIRDLYAPSTAINLTDYTLVTTGTDEGKLRYNSGEHAGQNVLDIYGEVVSLPVYTITEKEAVVRPWVPLNNDLKLIYQNPATANTVTIQNEKSTSSGEDPVTGTLVIQKRVVDPDGDPPANWSFDFEVAHDGTLESVTVTSARPIAIIDNVNMGTLWSVNEVPTSEYIGTVIPDSGTLSAAQPTVFIEAVNTPGTGSLKVKLTVDEQNGATPDPDAEFVFEITLTDEHGNPVTGVFGGPEGALEFDEHGKTHVTLKDGDERQIDKLPDGTQYTIKEITKDFGNIYEPGGSTTVSDDIEAGDADEVPFVIIKKADEPRGGFTIRKAPGGNAEDVFRFRIEFTGLKSGKTYTYQYGPENDLKTAAFTAKVDGTAAIEGCALKFSEMAVFTGLAEDVTFTVTELANDYIASCTIDDSATVHKANTPSKPPSPPMRRPSAGTRTSTSSLPIPNPHSRSGSASRTRGSNTCPARD